MRWSALAVVVGLLVALVACGDDEQNVTPAERDASIYATVLREMVLAELPPPAPDDEGSLPVLYVTGADGESIAVDVQAELVKNLKDDAEVRFVDAREDALVVGDQDDPAGGDDSEPAVSVPGDEPVQDDGVLTIFGPLPEDGTTVQVDVEIYKTSLVDQSFVVTLAGSRTKWVIRSTEPVD